MSSATCGVIWPRDFARFVAFRQDGAVEAEAVHHFERPAAVDHVEDGRARGVGNFRGEIARQLEAHVVLGQEHRAHALEIPRLVIADPQQLGQGEAGEHGVGDEFQDILAADFGIDGVHLRLAALVAPDQRGADRRGRRCRGSPGRASGRKGRCPLPGGPGRRLGRARRGWPATQASHQFSGRCSAHSGRSIRMSSWGDVQPARTAPRPSTRSARVPPVPMSMPSHIEPMVA